ncbi:MarR family winged helix-turn-helix transcriptional regulator [Cryptosporangium phraense]|uniref:Winged helix-turn-helix transcriptional regulator n=1 Tax=Cryptosporangium phraense TaxID=2593070 RepID=A0A545ATW4_9ACTN|nr:MarR family winged helix-turn-helix transcriptional regulator [Cryptosporangium phraense]TQS44787.1 winged helix-turn-helix transcriptional regulator [Cryptosporangium phraense]
MTRSLAEIGLSVKRLQMAHHRAANVALAPLGLSIVQWDALRHLRQNPDASLHDLAVLTFQTDQSFGTLAARLIDRGLIERVPGPGRAVKHRLTPHGLAVQEEGQAVLNDVLGRTFGALAPDELAAFDGLLTRLLASASG